MHNARVVFTFIYWNKRKEVNLPAYQIPVPASNWSFTW